MKYLNIILLFIVANFCFAWLNVNPAHWIQPFLIAAIFLYFAETNPWIHYSFAFVAGLIVDSFSASFGLHAISYILVLFLLNNLQLFIFTSKNTGTILMLTMIGVVAFWGFVWFLNFIFSWSNYHFSLIDWLQILKYYLFDVLTVVLMYIIYFNLNLKKHEG